MKHRSWMRKTFDIGQAGFQSMLDDLGIKDWDWVLVCDGSGTLTDNPIGWGAVLIGRAMVARVIHGSYNGGTNITAEIMGVLQPLLQLYNELAARNPRMPLIVHAITDCQHVTRPQQWAKYRDLRSLLRFYEQEGTSVVFHHVPRNSSPLGLFCHYLANEARTCQHGCLTAACVAMGCDSVDQLLLRSDDPPAAAPADPVAN